MNDEDIRVLVTDDEALLRGSFRLLIDGTSGMRVVGEATNGRAAVEFARAHRVDVVLMDLRMPKVDGIEGTRMITALPTPPRVLVLTTFDLDEYVHESLRAGASGFVLKDTPPAQVVEAVRVVAAGEALLSPSVTRRLLTEFVRVGGGQRALILGRLTEREREVLELITAGLSNGEIEQYLHLSRGTVKTHIGRLKTKLDARDRAQLVIAGYEAGLSVSG